MINDEDPPPLDAPESQSPESLVRALRALGRDQPSAAALRATRERLQARLPGSSAGAPPPVQTPGVQLSGTSTLLAGRLLVAAIVAVVGAGSFVLLRSAPESAQPSATAAPRPTARPAAEVERTAVPAHQDTAAPVNQTSVTARAPSAHHDSSAARELRSMQTRLPKAVVPRRKDQHASQNESARRTTPSAAPAPTTTTLTPEETSAPQPAPEPATTTVSAQQPAAAPRVTKPSQSVAPAGELALLLEARKQSHRDPDAALRLTAEHARRFPRGVLAPEREVLAIEALRALGATREADERLRRFRATYPDSLHTRALTTGTTL